MVTKSVSCTKVERLAKPDRETIVALFGVPKIPEGKKIYYFLIGNHTVYIPAESYARAEAIAGRVTAKLLNRRVEPVLNPDTFMTEEEEEYYKRVDNPDTDIEY